MPVTSTSGLPSRTAPAPRASSSSLIFVAEHNRAVIAEIGGHRFEWGSRTYVMGIVNVTPDSFSGDGLGTDADAAIQQGLRMVGEGADMLDVGGESTRPGHVPVTAAEEIQRVDAVLRRLAADAGVPVSIDTYKEEVAARAIEGGATILNDVWGLGRSPAIADLAARNGCALVLMHNQEGTDYAGDLMEEIKRFLSVAAVRAMAAGVPREKVILDPGIGFGKTADHNWEVMRRLEELRELGHPILIGRSEEHTSELQSHVNLVCRLLLEKKKKNKQHHKTRQKI